MCDDCSESTNTSETSGDTSVDTSCDTSTDTSTDTSSELPEDTGDLSNDGFEELPDDSGGDLDCEGSEADDCSEDVVYGETDSAEATDVEEEKTDIEDVDNQDSIDEPVDNTASDGITDNDLPDSEIEKSTSNDLYSDGSEELPDGVLDLNVFDDQGNLRVMNNEEYLSLSPEQQYIFERKYNTLSQEEKDAYDKQFAQADLENCNKQLNSDRNESTERDLKDIIDGQYQGNDDYGSTVCELSAKGAMSAVGTSMGLDPFTKAELTSQAGDIGRIYGPNAMESITRTAYVQNGIHTPTPIIHTDATGNKTYDYGQNGLSLELGNESPEIRELKAEYADDLIKRSEYPETIDKTILDSQWNKIPSEKNDIMRDDFGKSKNDLIKQWEDANDCKWPTYKEDIYSQGGKLIRRAGDKYDAHHIQPLTFGGENMSSNLTPLHALDHFDKQGIHSPDSPFGRIEKYYREN